VGRRTPSPFSASNSGPVRLPRLPAAAGREPRRDRLVPGNPGSRSRLVQTGAGPRVVHSTRRREADPRRTIRHRGSARGLCSVGLGTPWIHGPVTLRSGPRRGRSAPLSTRGYERWMIEMPYSPFCCSLLESRWTAQRPGAGPGRVADEALLLPERGGASLVLHAGPPVTGGATTGHGRDRSAFQSPNRVGLATPFRSRPKRSGPSTRPRAREPARPRPRDGAEMLCQFLTRRDVNRRYGGLGSTAGVKGRGCVCRCRMDALRALRLDIHDGCGPVRHVR
jgi:hypothetical protein